MEYKIETILIDVKREGKCVGSSDSCISRSKLIRQDEALN